MGHLWYRYRVQSADDADVLLMNSECENIIITRGLLSQTTRTTYGAYHE